MQNQKLILTTTDRKEKGERERDPSNRQEKYIYIFKTIKRKCLYFIK